MDHSFISRMIFLPGLLFYQESSRVLPSDFSVTGSGDTYPSPTVWNLASVSLRARPVSWLVEA